MSFTGASVVSAANTVGVGNDRLKPSFEFGASATFYVTFSGNATFTGFYKQSVAAGTATFSASQIIVQVIS